MPTLVLVADGKETRYDLGSRPIVVGRSVECDVQVSEERASRRHFQVEPSDRGWVLRDLDSSNGTGLNGYGIAQALLTPGDVIELGGVEFRFEAEGAAPAKAVRPPRKKPSTGPAWVVALALALVAAVATDEAAVGAARERDREIRKALDDADHAEFLAAARRADPAEAERALDDWLAAHPAAPDAAEARARLASVRTGRSVREEVARDWAEFQAAAPGLAAAERRWRMESLVRRWAGSPEALAEIRRRAAGTPQAPAPAEDARVLFQRRKREADAAAAAGNLGVALALWDKHAGSIPPDDPTMADVRDEIRKVERASAVKAAELIGRANDLRRDGKGDQGGKVLREGQGPLDGTSGGRRVAARLGSGGGVPGTAPSGKPSAGGTEGFRRQRELIIQARTAEQFVQLRDYRGAAEQYADIVAGAAGLPDIAEEMRTRAGWISRVADLLDAVRAAPGSSWKGKPWPESWESVPEADLVVPLQKAGKRPEDRLALASYCWDQHLLPQAVEAVCAALDHAATRAEAERLYSARTGVPVPEGGFVAEKGEVISRAEWKRRRNAEAIAKLREREALLVRRLHDTALVKGIDHFAGLRAELDKRRAHALELIFDEVKYFYPYQDRMGEYTPVQQEVNKRVEAVREVWEGKAKLRTKPDAAVAGHLKEFDEAARSLGDLGGEATAEEAEVARVRLYLDRDLDVRTYFTDAAELAQQAADAKVLKENRERKTAATDPERRQVEITNEYRLMFGRRALAIGDRLVLSARAHGVDMTKGGFFSHFNERLRGMKPGEKIPEQACGCSSTTFVPGCQHGPADRIRKQEYAFVACSENIHAGSGDPQGAHNGWIHSSGHHRNILMADWKEMGTGQMGSHWTQNFGVPIEPEDPAAAADGAGSEPWDRAGGRGTGGDGNPPKDR